ncbi:hypothetical protein FGG08_004265 [Glutinoglossum americanum]|uniref:Cation/H+ exchanger transmembrane domain-containing protein n=1 Tax=Glutinoglossum americanum TaxID=1670608 RepID=A0A9P8I7Y1_9PEZI|nr:hypothetical protein FGG08_004265 [Glutinoglossum americanum]
MSFSSVKANVMLSIAVAVTGIVLPVALSFVLSAIMVATPLQAFAAGAALCSTSLGTTFTLLSTSGLTETRLGTILTSAAMMDDVVGLIMVQVISNLGNSSSSFSSLTVVRPVVVSVGLVFVLLLSCCFVIKPLTLWLNGRLGNSSPTVLNWILQYRYTALIVHTLILIGMAAGATLAGTSSLFAAYLAGASISWWDSDIPHRPNKDGIGVGRRDLSVQGNTGVTPIKEHLPTSDGTDITLAYTSSTGQSTFRDYYSVVLSRILKPFFFVRTD